MSNEQITTENPTDANTNPYLASQVREYLELQPIISTERQFYFYDEKTGTWERKDKYAMESHIFLYFENDEKDIAFVRKFIDMIKYHTYRETFPRYAGEGNILVFKNIALNPVTGKELAFSQEHYALGRVDFDYSSNAECPQWHHFLDDVCTGVNESDTKDKKKLLQEFMFLNLTDITKFQKMLFLYGAGSNGKSVILDIVRSVVGEHNVSQVKLSEMTKKFRVPCLENKLVNIESDAEYRSLNEGYFKSLVSSEYIEVEHKYRGTYTFKPMATMWIATNVMPKVTSNSYGFYRRIAILEFNKIFSDTEQDKDLLGKLKSELGGITAWALQAGTELLKSGNLTVPESSKECLERYELDNNHVKDFVEQMVQYSKEIKRDKLYAYYCHFCKTNNYPVLNNARFGRELKPLGVESTKTSKGRFYTVSIKPEHKNTEIQARFT